MTKTYIIPYQLFSLAGSVSVTAQVAFMNDENPQCEVSVTYNGVRYTGIAPASAFLNAFFELDNQLPKGFYSLYCLNCRIGLMCPHRKRVHDLFFWKLMSIEYNTEHCKRADLTDAHCLSDAYDEYAAAPCGYCGYSPSTRTDYHTCRDYLPLLHKLNYNS